MKRSLIRFNNKGSFASPLVKFAFIVQENYKKLPNVYHFCKKTT